MSTLKRSSDRKVTNLATKGGSVKIKNTFGLPAGALFSCPGMTTACESVCYARRTEKQYVGVDSLVKHNWELVNSASLIVMISLLSGMIDEFRADCEKHNADKVFRIHWDGDFFSIDYAEAWATVIRNNPDIQFWVYTRSFVPALNVIPTIAGIDNLAVYLSVDEFNRAYVAGIISEFPSVRLATLTDYSDEGIEIVRAERDTMAPGAACPENLKQIPLITPEGGACFSCGLCITGKADIRFAAKKKRSA